MISKPSRDPWLRACAPSARLGRPPAPPGSERGAPPPAAASAARHAQAAGQLWQRRRRAQADGRRHLYQVGGRGGAANRPAALGTAGGAARCARVAAVLLLTGQCPQLLRRQLTDAARPINVHQRATRTQGGRRLYTGGAAARQPGAARAGAARFCASGQQRAVRRAACATTTQQTLPFEACS